MGAGMTGMRETTNIVLTGVGGQGALTMMEMLALAAEQAAVDVRVLSRVSLARLGGSNICHIRLGPATSPAIPVGKADILVTLEMSEVLRVLHMARPGALAFINTYRRLPIVAGVAGMRYPTLAEIEETLKAQGVTPIFVPETLLQLDTNNHNENRVNMIMLGVLCGYTHLLPRAALEAAIVQRMPEYAEQNKRVFDAGWEYYESGPAEQGPGNPLWVPGSVCGCQARCVGARHICELCEDKNRLLRKSSSYVILSGPRGFHS